MTNFEELIKDFIDDAKARIEPVERAILEIERDIGSGIVDSHLINTVLGSLHTLKGNSGMMGYDSLKAYIHRIEEILKGIIDGKYRIDNQILETLFEGISTLKDTIWRIEENPKVSPDLTTAISKLTGLAIEDSRLKTQDQRPKIQDDILKYLGTKSNTIRVDFERLDILLNLVGELVIYKTRLIQAEKRLKEMVEDKSFKREFNEITQYIGNIVSELQEGIMKVRMLPVSHVFDKFPRMVRDMAKSQGKEIELYLEGGDTELDKTVIDLLGEPLLHIIRNAIDHGIETPDERIKKGKSRKGFIRIQASQESNYILIKVIDDGRGIDREKVRQKALERGIISSDTRLQTPDPEPDIYSLIFTPGFSTSENVTEVSGRGIGLDVVRKNISSLNGSVRVESTEGKGTTFTIKLPLTLAILPALMVEASKEIYAIPLASVEESIKIRDTDIHWINNREVIKHRDSVLPLIRLGGFFNLGSNPSPAPSPHWGEGSPFSPLLPSEERIGVRGNKKRFYVVIVGRAERRIGLAVDRLKGQQEIVIKGLDDSLGRPKGIAGATILGDGRVVLILDVTALWARDINQK